MANEIKHLPPKPASKGITPSQGALNLGVDKEVEIGGIGMGVLTDGTPFLNQRGLARLCDVENAHIGNIATDWNEVPQKPRITTIKSLLTRRDITVEKAALLISHKGQTIHAYPDTVCLAILEYYAFEAGANCSEKARDNFRILAGKALQDFIYTQVGYSPHTTIPLPWRQFHDRVSLVFHAVPDGYFSIFKEMADIIVTLIRAGAVVDDKFVPDISMGHHWATHWKDNGLALAFGERRSYPHNYPDYFPQAKSNPQPAYCYPDQALAEFRRWTREVYLKDKFGPYLMTAAKKGALPPSFVKLALSALTKPDNTKSITH
jgi:hypothetical protein